MSTAQPQNSTSIKVFNLLTDETQYFMLEPQEALISAYILEHKLTSRLHDKAFRDELRAKITDGQHSFGLGDWATVKPKEHEKNEANSEDSSEATRPARMR